MKAIRKAMLCISILVVLSACSSNAPPLEPATTYSTSPSSDEVSISAMSLIGTPYTWGGNTPDSGFDCSGLIVYVFRNTGIKLPRTTTAMSSMSVPSVNKPSLKTGDLVFFSTAGKGKVSHAGIYVGDGRFVHAPSTGGEVKLSNLNEAYWSRAFLLGKRVISN